MDEYLKATETIESDHPLIRAKAQKLVGAETSQRDKVLRLFAFVRDKMWMNKE